LAGVERTRHSRMDDGVALDHRGDLCELVATLARQFTEIVMKRQQAGLQEFDGELEETEKTEADVGCSFY